VSPLDRGSVRAVVWLGWGGVCSRGPSGLGTVGDPTTVWCSPHHGQYHLLLNRSRPSRMRRAWRSAMLHHPSQLPHLKWTITTVLSVNGVLLPDARREVAQGTQSPRPVPEPILAVPAGRRLYDAHLSACLHAPVTYDALGAVACNPVTPALSCGRATSAAPRLTNANVPYHAAPSLGSPLAQREGPLYHAAAQPVIGRSAPSPPSGPKSG
jgi:hypothetical protein